MARISVDKECNYLISEHSVISSISVVGGTGFVTVLRCNIKLVHI